MRKNRPSKERHRSLFLSLQADAKEFPGGISGIAKSIGMNGKTLANGLNPDHEAPPPSFSVILEIIVLTQAKRSVFAIAQLVNQVTMDLDETGDSCSEEKQIELFLTLVSSASNVLGQGSEAAKDKNFNSSERRQLAPLLLSLMQITASLYESIND